MRHATRDVEMAAPPMAHLAFAERALGTRHPSTGVGPRPARAPCSHAGRRPERRHRAAARCVAREIYESPAAATDGPVLERQGFRPIRGPSSHSSLLCVFLHYVECIHFLLGNPHMQTSRDVEKDFTAPALV
jgi:hypothetical protein